jgi:glycosyltransferase involved in cell wall biosynthesis
MYSTALIKNGDTVDVISLRKKGQPKFSLIDGVRVYRIQIRKDDEPQGKFHYLIRVLTFLLKASLLLSIKHLKYRYDVVHVHSMPDFLVFSAWLMKIGKSRMLLDLHDLFPDLYVSKFDSQTNSLIFKFLCRIEKVSIAFADHVLIANHLWKQRLISRSVPEDKISVVMNYPDITIFNTSLRKVSKNRFLVLYPGTLNWHQGVDIAVRAFAQFREYVTHAKFHIYGKGPEKRKILELIREFGLEEDVLVYDFLPLSDISRIFAGASMGVVPKRSDSFGNEAFSTKILQFMATGVPVVVSNTKIDTYYFNDSLVEFFQSGDVDDLARTLLYLFEDANRRQELILNGLDYVRENNWQVKQSEYFEILKSIA